MSASQAEITVRGKTHPQKGPQWITTMLGPSIRVFDIINKKNVSECQTKHRFPALSRRIQIFQKLIFYPRNQNYGDRPLIFLGFIQGRGNDNMIYRISFILNTQR